MSQTNLPLEPLVRALQAGPRLRFAMLFGSAAKGTARADSDLDVGIFPDDPTSRWRTS